MCHFCTCVCLCMCAHVRAFEIFFQKARKREVMNGKVSFWFCFLPVTMSGKQNKTNPQKVRRWRLKAEILWILFSFLLGWKISVLLGKKRKKKKINRLFSGAVSLSPPPLLMYQLIFFRVLHISRHKEISALISRALHRSPEWPATATPKSTLALSITHPTLLQAKKSHPYKTFPSNIKY